MSSTRRTWVTIFMIFYAVLNNGNFSNAPALAPAHSTDDSLILTLTQQEITVDKNETILAKLTADNNGTSTWNLSNLSFVYVFPTSRQLYTSHKSFYNQSLWENQSTIKPSYDSSFEEFLPGESTSIFLPLTAPNKDGWYRFYFRPFIGNISLDRLITINLQVGEVPKDQLLMPEKQIAVSLDDQTATLYEDKFEVAHFKISSGREAMETPPGKYIINKKLDNVISKTSPHYSLPYWMELRTLDFLYDGYGIHGLAYFPVNSSNYTEGRNYSRDRHYTDGRMYEGWNTLGTPTTQGCVALSMYDIKLVYDWVEPEKTLIVIK
ncbi:MAG: L,D-transpeptidase [Patescibacteria group bacterium]|nr:L,D-transpeptidase [Patescibacteria group bacterium]